MKIHELSAPALGDIVEFEINAETVVEGEIIGETEDGYIYEFSSEGLAALMEDASGYIPKNSREAKDPRWSSALTQDVTTHTMRDQISAFFPTKAPKGHQTQVTEAAPDMVKTLAGATAGAAGGAAGWVLGSLFGPIGSIAGAATMAGMGMKSGASVADDVWDWASQKLGGREKEFAASHIQAAAAGKPQFTVGGKTFDVTLKPNEVKPAMQAVKTQESVEEAKYKGREVKLGKPIRGGNKKSYVYVRNPETGNVIKVSFGDPNMRIKKSNPARRRSFRARHKCSTAKDRTSARYWSCRAW